MHSSKGQTLYLLSFDVDGTLAGPNYATFGIFGVYEMLLKELQQLPGVEVVLNSGKSIDYLEMNAVRFGGRYVIACNGAACQVLGGDRMIFGGNHEDLLALRSLLGLKPHDEGVRTIRVDGRSYEVAVEEEKHDVVLTVFTEPEWVKHRWQFKGGIDRHGLYEHLQKLIQDHNLHLHTLHPHGDGAIDIVRLHQDKPIDKSTLPDMVAQLWPGVKVKMAMFGDGANDVPAMTAPGVIGITFPEASEEKVKAPVREHGGIITTQPAWIKKDQGGYISGGGVIEGVRLLAERGFFDDLTEQVFKICNNFLSSS